MNRWLKSLVTQPPLIYRILFPEAIWRLKTKGAKTAYITFDDGPVPAVTPGVLDILDQFGVKATFFMVGQNAERHPELVEEVRRRGHTVGNHTMHHLQGLRSSKRAYLRDVALADDLLQTTLFRPPHGLLKWKQSRVLKHHYNLIMYDVVTRDYARHITPDEVVDNVRRFARNGSIIVFHDSEKSAKNTLAALPKALQWLRNHGFDLRTL